MNKNFLYLMMLCGACASDATPTVGQTAQDMISLNGRSLNGISLNGISLNGTSLTGQTITSVSTSGTSATGSAITTSAATAAPWTGAGLVGSTWRATTSGGSTVQLRIDSAAQGEAPNADLWFYGVSYQSSAGWSPVCGVDANNAPIQAFGVAGVWGPVGGDATAYSSSASQFTLACRGKTVAKCVELGYKPFKSLATTLQACVRLLRADYCGNGTSYTVDGTTLNLYDNAGVQADTESWLPEAEWGPSGAICINSQNNSRYMLLQASLPSCFSRSVNAGCGRQFSTGVLIDELPPGEVP